MAIFAAAGAKLFIGGSLPPNFTTALTAADFIGQTWVEVAPLQSIGTVGDNAAVVTFDALGDGRTYKLKGVKNAGTLQAVAGFDPSNAGQIAALAAADSPNSFATRIVMNDAPPSGTASERLFTALYMSSAQSIDTANSVVTLQMNMEVNSNVVFVPTTSGGSAPDNTVAPAITGTAQVGQTLTVSNGTWTGTPAPTFGYQWFLAGESIPGATGNTYVPVVGDIGSPITAQVRAINPLGVRYRMTAATSNVIAA